MAVVTAIDLNADLGETVDGEPTADDEAMFAVISSASVACGGHAGDAASMRASVQRAVRFGVAIGAHPSYPDRANFGRLPVRMDPAELERAVGSQLTALVDAEADIRYVKAHGALYHAADAEPEVASAVVGAITRLSNELGRPLPVLGAGDALEAAVGGAGLTFVHEAFLDRRYRPDGRLVDRDQPDALLHDPAAVAARALRLVVDGVVEAVDGTVIAVHAASLCLHGDSPAAVTMARAVRTALDAVGIEVRAPW